MALPGATELENGTTYKNAVLTRQAFAAATPVTLIAAVAGKAHYINYLHITCLAATIITVKIGSTVVWEGDFTANWPMNDATLPNACWIFTGAQNVAVTVTSSAATTVGVTAGYYEA